MTRDEFERDYRSFRKQVLAYHWRNTQDRELARDLTQETFMRAWLWAREIPVVHYLDGLIFRIAKNTYFNYLASWWNEIQENTLEPPEDCPRREPVLAIADSRALAPDLLEDLEALGFVDWGINQLPLTDAVAVRLDLDEIPHKDAAAKLGITVGGFRNKLMLAKRRLAGVLLTVTSDARARPHPRG